MPFNKINVIFTFILIAGLFPSMFCQINLDLSFSHYQENYQPLTHGDTIYGLDNEEWGSLNPTEWRIIPLDPIENVPGMEDWSFDELIIVPTGVSGLFSFNEELMQEVAMVFSAASTFNYCSPLIDEDNSDQAFIIFQRDEEFIRIDYQNLAHLKEYNSLFLRLISRFNFQVEYRLSDSRVRFIYGPSNVTTDLQEYFQEEYCFTYFGYELSEYFDEDDIDWVDVEIIGLLGLAEDPSISRSSSVDLWPPQISLVNFPPDGTVYEFFTSPSTSSTDIAVGDINLKVFPNPTVDLLYIELDETLSIDNEYQIEIYNVAGELKLEREMTTSDKIDLTSLASGTYILRISSENIQGTVKLIKE